MSFSPPKRDLFLRESRRQRIRRGLLLGSLLTLIILLIWAGNIFTSLRLGLNNVYFLSSPTQDKIAIVALDNQSLETYGRSPTQWSRSLYADFMDVMGQAKARTVAFDLLFVEPTDDDEVFAEAIQRARFGENDSRVRTILATAGVQPTGIADNQTLQFETTLKPVPILAEAADNLGYANTFTDTDNIVRRQPSLIKIGEEEGVSFGMAVYLSYLTIPPVAIPQFLETKDGSLYIKNDPTQEHRLYVDTYGLWQQDFFGSAGETYPTYSFMDVVNGEVDPEVFTDKIVLVGLLNATGAVDRYNVPIELTGASMAGVEIQANAIETLLQKVSIRQQSTPSKLLMILLFTLGASLFYTYFRWYWTIVLPIPTIIGAVILAFLIFDTQNIIVDLFYLALSLGLPPVATLGLRVASEVSRRQRTEFLLESVLEVSTQQMDVNRMLPLIAQDIQRSVKTKGGAIYLWDSEQERLELRFHWFPDAPPNKHCLQYFMSLQNAEASMVRGKEICIPIFWQKSFEGGFYIELADGQARQQAIDLLETLTEQITPSLANARLFTRIQRQTQLLQAVLDGSPNGIMLLKPDLTLLSGNPQSDTAFSKTALSEFQDQPFDKLLETAGLEESQRHQIMERFAIGRNFQHEMRLDHQVFYLYAVRLNADDKWVVILNDVSVLVELSELKTQMIRMASHDLKNPLTNIMSYVSFVQDEPELNDNQRRFLGNVMRSADQMLEIISGILNLEQVQAGKLEYEPLYFHQLVGIVAEQYMNEAQLKKIIFTAKIDTDLPRITGDFRMLSQAASNLIGNAIKYTPDEGTVMIRLFATDHKTLRMEIQDSGYGIPAEAQAKLFSQFYRVRTAATAHIKGTGLGLSLVKSVIEHHGGKVWVHSIEGEGSTFFVELPIVEDTTTLTLNEVT